MSMEEDDDFLISRLAHGDGAALEPLMERWGDHLLDTCFRAMRDGPRTLDLYAELWATIYTQIRYSTKPLPRPFGPSAVAVIADLLDQAANAGHIPQNARLRMKLAPTSATDVELERIAELRDPDRLRAAREALPGDFSAAAERMLSRMPGSAAMSRVLLSTDAQP